MVVGQIYNPWRTFVGCVIPNCLLRSEKLSPTAKLIFGRLCQYSGKNGQAYPSYKVLGSEVGIKRRQAIRAVKELEVFGLIKSVGRYRTDGGTTSNVYEFLWHEVLVDSLAQVPSAISDTGGSDKNDIPPGCNRWHPGVSGVTPKENQTKESPDEMDTNEQVLTLLLGTPLSKISEMELRNLIDRHGLDRVKKSADIGAETWRKGHKEIVNPGGYLQTLCTSHVVPTWYEVPEVREAKRRASEERKKLAIQKEQEASAAEKLEENERNRYWQSLSAEERDLHILTAKESSAFTANISLATIEMVAKCNVWKLRAQTRTNSSINS